MKYRPANTLTRRSRACYLFQLALAGGLICPVDGEAQGSKLRCCQGVEWVLLSGTHRGLALRAPQDIRGHDARDLPPMFRQICSVFERCRLRQLISPSFTQQTRPLAARSGSTLVRA